MSLFELLWHDRTVDALAVRLVRGRHAQSTVEYALVGALVVIAAAAAMTVLGEQVTAVFTNIGNTLRTAAAR
jgi:Flp pilus assembly pilin Flp